MLAGGADTRVAPIAMIRHGLFDQLSRRHDEPEKACRPFDLHRDGTVLGEGAGLLLLEEREHALRRGAPIRAELLGFGSAFDRGRTGAGLARAVRAALAEANVTPDQIDHINAHGAGTRPDDAWEARGLREALGDMPVVGFKGYLGNLGSGASTVELAASLLALEDGTLPGTLNHDEADPECPVNVAREPRPVRRPCVLKVSCTEMGQCAALVVRKA
jgi:3-oxoacyl-[acyl-carrier-protein] synthase II